MTKLHIPFYDPEKSYDENYEEGPFGAFADEKVFVQKGEPEHDYLGQKVFLPFGIPAGPIINSNYVKSAFDKGFDIVVYKTVRSDFYPCHPFPNVLSVNVDGDLKLQDLQTPLVANKDYNEPLSITNSFGVPSKKPEIWQDDVRKSINYARKGQALVLSFMGTVRENQSQQEFIDDFVLAAKLSYETGAKILEVNLSCPNIGNEGLVCYNLEVTEKVVKGIREAIGNTPLILKVGYYSDENDLGRIAEVANEYANGIAAINTLQAAIVNEKGEQALPGKMRLRSGVCGAAIKWAGIEMVSKLNGLREKNNYKFSIDGVGGVTVAEDYDDYIKAGADAVFSATGAMWNPFLTQEIKKTFNK